MRLFAGVVTDYHSGRQNSSHHRQAVPVFGKPFSRNRNALPCSSVYICGFIFRPSAFVLAHLRLSTFFPEPYPPDFRVQRSSGSYGLSRVGSCLPTFLRRKASERISSVRRQPLSMRASHIPGADMLRYSLFVPKHRAFFRRSDGCRGSSARSRRALSVLRRSVSGSDL